MIHAKKGFTIIELTLSMAFISALLIAIAITTIQVAGSYNKGLTIKSVTIAGSDISVDIQRSISSSMPFSLDVSSGKYVTDTFGGRLCLGSYSYIWNYGKSINDNTYTNKYSSGSNLIRLVKAPDTGGAYCADPKMNINPYGAIDLLTAGDRNLSIHSFKIDSESTAYDSLSNSRLYTVTYAIGTNTESALNSDYLSCKGPGESGADPDYCAVQQFSFSVSAGNLYQQ